MINRKFIGSKSNRKHLAKFVIGALVAPISIYLYGEMHPYDAVGPARFVGLILGSFLLLFAFTALVVMIGGFAGLLGLTFGLDKSKETQR